MKSKAFSTSGRLKVIVARGGGLLVEDLEAELGGLGDGSRSRDALNGMPIVAASCPAAPNSGEVAPAVNASMSGNSNSA